MKWSKASLVEQVCWDMKLADLPRGGNRAKIDELAGGWPPWTEQEAQENAIDVNVNFLALTKILADCRMQFFNAFCSTRNYFTIDLDYGPKHKRKDWSRRITAAINRRMRKSKNYFEIQRSTHAQLASHGIGPKVWFDNERWCPDAVGIEDVMIPSGTLLSMKNLPFFAVFSEYTAAELYDLTHGPIVDPGWNMALVDRALKWADGEWRKNTNYSEVYSPEKMVERFKQDLGMYGSDACPTIDTWHFFYWCDDNKQAGWRKRVILDTPAPSGAKHVQHGTETIIGSTNEFLFDPGDRVYADDISQIVHWHFGDTSPKGPFRYHSVRSLGFLLYAVCHLQNRLQCQFSASTFESLLQYFRVKNPEDADRALKAELAHRGVIPHGLEFVKAEERWNINEGLVQQAILMNRQTMADASTSFTQNTNFGKTEREETATEIMAKVNQASALVNSMLSQAYRYSEFEYLEECRRFCIPDSRDPDVRRFRLEILKSGIPEKALNSECWDVEAEKVIGSGNRTLQFALADKLMQARPAFPPAAQQEILHEVTSIWTGDPDRADRWVPLDEPIISDSVHDAQLASGTLLQGLPVSVKRGINHLEYVETLLAALGAVVKRVEDSGGVATWNEIVGMVNLGDHIEQHIQILAGDPEQKQRVKQYEDALGRLMNMVKAYRQRFDEAQKAQQQAQGGPDPADAAKLAAQQAQSQAKIESGRESHAQRTSQRQVQWEMEQRREQERHNADLQRQEQQHALDMRKQADQHALDVASQAQQQQQPKASE